MTFDGATAVTSNGSVNAIHDSLTPLGGLLPMIGMWLNNIFGGVGVGLIPLALRGVSYNPLGAAAILRRNLLIYGVGGVALPFLGIKAIDLVLVAVGLA